MVVSKKKSLATIPLFYYTASGNTKYCSELVQRGFQDKFIQVELIRIETVRNLPFPEKENHYPAIGLAFPVFEFMVPRIILIWLHQLPPAKQTTPVFIIDTSGGMPCNSAGIAMDLLRKKNYEPLGVVEVPTPTIEPFFDNKYYPAGWAPEILNRCYSFGSLLANRLRKEDSRFIDLRLGRFRFPALTKYAYRYFIKGQSSSSGLIKFDSKVCTKCGACERVCPMAAIDISNLSNPFNLNRCMFCATCIRTCPTHAIKISYRTGKIPPSAKTAPKSRPGYIDPKYYRHTKTPKIGSGIITLSMAMMRARKLLVTRKV